MQVKLIRRWSDKPALAIVKNDDTQGQWLLDHGFAKRVDDERSHEEVEGALQPSHSFGRPATQHHRPETGVSGAVEGAPDAVHNRVRPDADAPAPAKPTRRTKSA